MRRPNLLLKLTSAQIDHTDVTSPRAPKQQRLSCCFQRGSAPAARLKVLKSLQAAAVVRLFWPEINLHSKSSLYEYIV